MIGQILRILDFSGGESSIYPYLAMPQKFAVKLQNCHVSETGGLGKIPGYSRVNLNPLEIAIKTGFEYKKSDGTTIILAAGSGKIWKLNVNVLEDLKIGLNGAAKVWFAQIADKCIMSNGVDVPMIYDGAAVPNLGGLPVNTKFIKPHVHKGRVWWTDGINRMMAFHSALNAPEDYTTAANAGYIDFRYVLPRGDELLDIVTYVDLLVFLFRNHVVIYSGTNPTAGGDFRVVQVISGVGVVSPNVALPLGSDLLFLHDTGVKSLRQVVTTGNMSIGDVSKYEATAIQREIKYGLALGNDFAVAHYPQRGWSCFLINEVVWIYSYIWKAWGRMVGADVNGLFHLMNGRMYLCGTGLVYDYGGYWSFDQTPINMVWESPWMPYSRQNFMGYPKIMEMMFGKGVNINLDVMISHDMNAVMPGNIQTVQTKPGISFMDAPQADTWDNAFFMDSVTEFGALRLPLFGYGKAVQIIISNISTQGPIEWNNIIIQGVMGGKL
ncbi:MAG: hypothetical protein FD174_2575 [Geobacteraceae bacterium]|nr:MAG: hypothetical protein FD174_2575 [Geobacteraceae bacterium]